jgi:hypothetical protein
VTTAKFWIVPTVMAVATWLVVSFLDVIPAEVAPNCRPELKHFSATLTSIQSLYGFGIAFSGCEYRPVPMTSWACVGSSLVALACGALMGQMHMRRYARKAGCSIETGSHGSVVT